jgi:hypothetical protein
MPWLSLLAFSATADVSPIGTAAGDIITYILGYGVLGVAAVLFALGYIVPRPVMTAAVDRSRADLVEENKRLIAEKAKAEEQRDAALKIAQEQIVPLATTFTAVAGNLLPVLQELVSMGEDLRHRPGGDDDRRRR